MTIRVLIADDQPMIRAGLSMLLGAEEGIDVVGETGDGAATVAAAGDLHPDVILMDVRMPVMDGVEATRTIVADTPSGDPDRLVRVLILTTYHVDDTVYAALRAGASGFLLKDAAPQDLISAVRAVAAGDAWLDPAVARGLIDEFATRPRSVTEYARTLGQLTPRESEVLVLVGHGMSNTEIAEWLVVSEATVKTHLSRVLMKLGLRDRAQAVAYAYQSGLIQPGTAPPRRAD